MAHKVFLSDDNTADLVCSACNRYYKKDMSRFLDIDSSTKIKIKCKCGHTWRIVLEKRKFFRKKTNLPGTYKYQVTGQKATTGTMSVLDISRTGLKLKVNGRHQLKNGDWIEVEFRLDNQVKTLINRIVNIKNVNGPYVGASFREMKTFDPIIGFYMLQHTPEQEK